MKIKRFGVSLEEELLEKLDSLTKKHKFPNRSQTIRFLIRKNLTEEAFKENKVVYGVVTLVYDHHKRELVNKLIHIQHNFSKMILSDSHVHLDHNNCLEIIAIKAKTNTIKDFADSLMSQKGIKQGNLVIVSK